jgi:hypothetical protein
MIGKKKGFADDYKAGFNENHPVRLRLPLASAEGNKKQQLY